MAKMRQSLGDHYEAGTFENMVFLSSVNITRNGHEYYAVESFDKGPVEFRVFPVIMSGRNFLSDGDSISLLYRQHCLDFDVGRLAS